MCDSTRLLDELYRLESRRVFASLVRLLHDFDLAEEAMQEAFAVAVEKWPLQGIPENPRAWLVSTGRFKGIDIIRRRARGEQILEEAFQNQSRQEGMDGPWDEAQFQDDQLRLIFTCCHPSLSSETQVALTLREVCGLTTEEVARAFLMSPTTIAQRIVRGKSKIRNAKIPYEIPSSDRLPERLESILSVLYLVFNEGYAAHRGDLLTRADLSCEAIRLARELARLLPDSEVHGLLALMLLQDSRRNARTDSEGNIVLLEQQDRALWDREQIREGQDLVRRALSSRSFGVYTLQAAIAAIHSDTMSHAATDWAQIVALYDLLKVVASSPVVLLNRAVALSMRDGPQAGLEAIQPLVASGQLQNYHLFHATQADFLRRLQRHQDARLSYQKALDLSQLEPERRFLQSRIKEMESYGS